MAFLSWRTWVAGNPLPAASLNQDLKDNMNAIFPQEMDPTNYQPTLEAVTTAPSVSVTGRQYQVGGMLHLWARYSFSAIQDPSGSGVYFVTLPVSAVGITSSATIGSGQVVGSWQARDSDPSTTSSGQVLLRSATTIHFNIHAAGVVGNAAPWNWGGSDILSFYAMIPI